MRQKNTFPKTISENFSLSGWWESISHLNVLNISVLLEYYSNIQNLVTHIGYGMHSIIKEWLSNIHNCVTVIEF
jgi:hypothetical protein